MQFQALEPYKEKYPAGWSIYFDQLDQYLTKVRKRPAGNQRIVPVLFAKALQKVSKDSWVDEDFAMVLLHLADKAGIVRPVFVAYSPEEYWIVGEFPNLDEIPPNVYSEGDDKEFAKEDLYVDLQFEFRENANASSPSASSA